MNLKVGKNPKERAFIKKYIKTFNPINPSEALIAHLDTVKLPNSGYLNKNTRGMRIIDITSDQLDYIAYRCEQCPSDMRLISKVLYFIIWYKSEIDNGDKEDLEIFIDEFKQEFEGYDIDFDAIFSNTSSDNSKEIYNDNILIKNKENSNCNEVISENNTEVNSTKSKITSCIVCGKDARFGTGIKLDSNGICQNCR